MVTLSTLISRVRRRANMEESSYITDTSEFITDAEITDYLNEAGSMLHADLVDTNENYAVSFHYATITSGNTFSLPSDFLKLKGVHRKDGDGYVTMLAFDVTQMNDYRSPYVATYNTIFNEVRYNLLGSTVYIEPSSSATGTYRVVYSPAYTKLVNSGDTLGEPEPWADYLVLYAALQCRIKENVGSTTELERNMERVKAHITGTAARRGQPRTAKRLTTRSRRR